MMQLLHIGVWDNDASRATRTLRMVESILHKHQRQGQVIMNCEPPQVSRSGLDGLFPVLEIAGSYWHLHPGQDFTPTQIENLLFSLNKQGILEFS